MQFGLTWVDHFQRLFKSSQPAQQVFSRRWVDCSSQASQLSKSSVDAGLIVQVKPASSSHLNLIPRVLYRQSSRLNSTLGRTQSRQPIGGSGSQLNGPRMIRERPIKPTL